MSFWISNHKFALVKNEVFGEKLDLKSKLVKE
jgi:hypothetical protein